MTEKETKGIELLEHYAADDDGRVILTNFAESIQVANGFERMYWTPTVRKMNGWTVNLRLGTTYGITLRRDDIEILLMPDVLNDEEREAIDDAGDMTPFKPKWGARRYRLNWAGAGELWPSVEKAHHEVLKRKRSASSENPEAVAVIDFLSRKLQLALPYPEAVAPSDNAGGNPASPLLEAYAASEPGRALLSFMAKSIRVAHADNRELVHNGAGVRRAHRS